MTTNAPDGVTLRMLVLRRRLQAFAGASPLALAPTLASILVLLVTYAPAAPGWAAAPWAVVALLVLSLRVLVGARLHPDVAELPALERQWRHVNVALFVGSIAWAASMPLLAFVARGTDEVTFAIIGAVLFSGVLLLHRSAPVAAVFHIVTMGAGLIAAQAILSGHAAAPLAILIVLYAATLIVAVRAQDRQFHAASLAELQRHESETRVHDLLSEHETRAAVPSLQDDARNAPKQDHAPIEDRVRAMAHLDPLTGLPNRHVFAQRLREVLARETQAAAILSLDLDDFRAVNDHHGPRQGDALLRAIGTRLRAEMPSGDLVARLGSDAFAVLVEAPTGDAMLIERAHRLLAVVRAPLAIDGGSVLLSAGIGIARAADAREAEELLRRAELALHAAKAKGRDRIALFDEGMDRRARERRMLERQLRDALGQDQMILHYQPIVSISSGAVVGYEALLRWHHPERGLLPPDRFLGIAEETGLMAALGEWVIRRALAETADWRGDFRLAVNLSASQVRAPLLVQSIDAALAASGFPAERLEFEITEHTLFNDGAMLERLRALGAEIALDDFGTGYSSLSYLRRFRFDRVKIDRSFVADLETSAEARAIVEAITRLAGALGMRTTAEGVETPGQLDLLRKLGCDEAQGFLILEPLPAREIEAHRAVGKGAAIAGG